MVKLSDFKPSEAEQAAVDAIIAAAHISDSDLTWHCYSHALAYAAQLKVERDASEKRVHTMAAALSVQGDKVAALTNERDSLARRVEALERMVERSAV